MDKKNKRAQEEIVGFAMIIIIVAIILLFIISFSLKSGKKEGVESYEANSFVQALLHYTTECRDYFGYLSIKDIILECDNGAFCLDGEESCEILNSTLENILKESWLTGEDRPIKGYELTILVNSKELISFTEGNVTRNYKVGQQDFTKKGSDIDIFFRVYY